MIIIHAHPVRSAYTMIICDHYIASNIKHPKHPCCCCCCCCNSDTNSSATFRPNMSNDPLLESLLASAPSFLAPDPDAVPQPRFANDGPPLVAPDPSELPLPFLRHSGLLGFIVGQLQVLQLPLGDHAAYIRTVQMLWCFQRWWAMRHWQLL